MISTQLSNNWSSGELIERGQEWNLSYASSEAADGDLSLVKDSPKEKSCDRDASISDGGMAHVATSERINSLLYDGPGLALIHGVPVDTEEAAAKALEELTGKLGFPVPQNKAGDRLGRVEDLGAQYDNPTHRGHKTSAALPFHSDRCDVIALLCIRNATSGGRSQLASVARVYDLLQAEAPAVLRTLESPFPYDRRGEEEPGESPWTELPIFVNSNGKVLARYIRRFIESSQRHETAPRLSPEQLEAMDVLDGILKRPEVVYEMDFEEGQLQLIENHTIMHARTEFSGGQRLLLRLWLSTPKSPELPSSFKSIYWSTDSGTVRGGLWPDNVTNLVGTRVNSLI